MDIHTHTVHTKERGAAMMISLIFFIMASVLVVVGMTGPTAREYRTASDSLVAKQSYFAAESAAEDAYYRLKNAMTLGSSTMLVVGPGTATAAISSPVTGQKQIHSIANIYNTQRAVDITHNDGTVNFDILTWAETQ